MVCYLLTCSWFAIFFALPQYNRYKKSDKGVKLLAVAQSYIVFATILAIYGTAPRFGSDRDCNSDRSMVLFGPFDAVSKGRKVGLALYLALVVGYTIMVWHDYNSTDNVIQFVKNNKDLLRNGSRSLRVFRRNASPADAEQPAMPLPRVSIQSASTTSFGNVPPSHPHLNNISVLPGRPRSSSKVDSTYSGGSTHRRRQRSTAETREQRAKRKEREMITNPEYRPNVDGRVILNLMLIIVASAIAIANTELLRHFNHPNDADQDWGFGQVRPSALREPLR
jgi:hypothetical protein